MTKLLEKKINFLEIKVNALTKAYNEALNATASLRELRLLNRKIQIAKTKIDRLKDEYLSIMNNRMTAFNRFVIKYQHEPRV
jgi:predicted  nucleic acid-binding Zn-ribbon protein